MNKNILSDFVEEARGWTPVIICGAARSGTRMISDIMNQHSKVHIEGEMHAQTMKAYLNMLSQVDQVFRHYSEKNNRVLDEHWMAVRPALHHLFFATACKATNLKRNKANIEYHGIKTPGYEKFFRHFERIFSSTPPLYIYAIRDAGSVWRSWKLRGYDTSVESFTERYLRSLREAISIKEGAPSRFVAFNLDDYIAATDKPTHIAGSILKPLGMDDMIAWPDGGMGNRNSTQKRGETLPDDDVTQKEVAMLREHPEMNLKRQFILER